MSVHFVDKNDLAMAWIDLSYVQNSLFSRQPKAILQSLNGQINFHTLTALMGPSGAGKTTLLKCINMMNNTGLTPNTKIYANKYTPLKACFIMQNTEEHLLMGLTVRETILFASKIKNRVTNGVKYRDSCVQTGHSLQALDSYTENMSENSYYSSVEFINEKGDFDHDMNVNEILRELLLVNCAHNLVNACSGGEQKRLTVGLELVQQNKPNLLCIDEPTSGLDSNAAELVIQCLSKLTDRHRMAIVTSIHQPNSLLLSLFDQLYVLSKGGHCVFTGRPNHLRNHLQACGITYSEDVLPIELLLKLSSNVSFKGLNKEKFDEKYIRERDETLTEENQAIDKLMETVGQSCDEIRHQIQMNGKLLTKNGTKHTNRFNFYHLFYLTLRGFSCFMRYDWQKAVVLTIFALFVGMFFAYLFGTEVGKVDGCVDHKPTNGSHVSPQAMEEILQLMRGDSSLMMNFKCQYFVDVYMAFIFMSSAVLTIPSEIRVVLTEHNNKWYSTGAYFWSKYFTEIPITIAITYIYSLITYYFTGQLNDMFRFAYYCLIKLAGIFIATSMGQMIGIIFSNYHQLANIIAIGLFLALFLLSGFLVPTSYSDDIIKGLSYISSLKFTFESTLVTLYGFGRCRETQTPLILRENDLDDESLWTNAYILLGFPLILFTFILIS